MEIIKGTKESFKTISLIYINMRRYYNLMIFYFVMKVEYYKKECYD